MQDITSFVDPITHLPIPAAMVQKIIYRQAGNVRLRIKAEVVDTSFNPVTTALKKPTNFQPTQDIPVWDGSDIGIFITPDASVTHDVTQPVHRSFDFTMLDPKQLDTWADEPFPFNPFTQLLRVSQVMIAGGTTLQVPVGYFAMLLPQIEIHPGQRLFKWQGLDLTSFVGMTPLLSDLTVTRFYPGGYIQAIKDLLSTGPVPKSQGGTGQTFTGNDDAGPGIPAWMLSKIVANSQNIQPLSDVLFQAGTNRLDAINQLLRAINYYDLWIDEMGYFRAEVRPYYPNSGTIQPVVGWDYSTMPETSIIESPIAQDFNSQANTDTCNIVRVDSDNTQGNVAFTSWAINTGLNASGQEISAIGTNLLRGLGGGPRAIGRYEKNAKISSQELCDLRAKILLQRGAQLPETLSINSLHNPLHQDHDILVCQVTNKEGGVEVPSSPNSPFEEQSWTLPLRAAGSRMAHALLRVVAL